MKGKRVGKNDANAKITQRCVIEEEIEILGVKPLRRPPSGNQFTRQSVGIHELARDPQSLIYPMYLSSPSSYSNKVFRNCILSRSLEIPQQAPCCICHPWLLLMLPSSTKTSLNTLKMVW